MKHLILSMMCLMMVGFSAHTYAQSGPKFQFKEGETHDFGEVKEGPDVIYEFVFTNTGDAPLMIQDATPSCSCTTPEWDKSPVLPGQTGKIKVGYKTKDHVGPFNKEIYIRSNVVLPNGERRKTIYIKGTVKAASNNKEH